MATQRSVQRALLVGIFALTGLAWWLYVKGQAERASAVAATHSTRQDIPRSPAVLVPASGPAPGPVPTLPVENSVSARVERETLPAPRAALAFEDLGDNQGVLQVRVLALETGQQLAGVKLRLETPAGRSLARVPGQRSQGGADESLVSDAEGRADFRVPADEELVLHAGFDHPLGRAALLRIAPLSAGQYRTAVVEVFDSVGRAWCACVVDGSTGFSIPDATLTLVKGEAWAPRSTFFEARTGADGCVSLELCADCGPRFRVEAAEYGTRLVEAEEGHQALLGPQTIELLRSCALEVFVVDGSGAPRSGFQVSWTQETLGELGTRSALLKGATDRDGRCLLTNLLARVPVLVKGTRGGSFRSAALVLEPGEARRLVWTQENGCVLTGEAHDQHGAPLAGLELWLVPDGPGRDLFSNRLAQPLRFELRCDERGAFRVADLGAGAWRIGPRPERSFVVDHDPQSSFLGEAAPDAPAPFAQAFEVAEGQREHQISLQIWRGLYLHGRAVDAGGEPRRFARVRADWNGHTLYVVTDEVGAFKLGPLPPGEIELEGTPPQRVAAGTEGIVLVLPEATEAEARRERFLSR